MTLTDTIAAARAAGKHRAVFDVEEVSALVEMIRTIAEDEFTLFSDEDGVMVCRYCGASEDVNCIGNIRHEGDCIWLDARELIDAMEGTDGK